MTDLLSLLLAVLLIAIAALAWMLNLAMRELENERLTRHGAELYIMPEADAVEIDGKDWYTEDEEAEIIDLPPSARRLRRQPTN